MGTYGSPNHLPDDQGSAQKHKKGFLYSDLPKWQKTLLLIYCVFLGIFTIIMFVCLETYMGNKILGAILAAAFFIFGLLFTTKVSAHKKAWPFVLCSIIAFFAYFGVEPSNAVQTANAPTEVSSEQQQPSSAQSQTSSAKSQTSSAKSQVSRAKSQASSTAPAADDTMKVDCQTLYKDYENNPIKADSKYRDKKLKLTGTIANIDRDIGQSPYITFNIDEYGLKSIKMSFDDDSAVINLKKGQKVTVEGTCGGTFASTIVVLNDCSITK